MEKTNEFNPEAVEWVDRVNSASGTAAGWRLEVLTKRFRKKYKDDDKKIPIRIRRFVRGLPWALVHDAAKYLMSLAPYEGVIYNGVKIEGKYRPTVTRWVRDDQERVDGQASGSYTLIQDLIEDDVTDEFSATSGGSCSEEVLTEWRWDDPDIIDISALPDFGAQGVSYSIQAVHRNEDGTYGYAVIKRVAKTQFSGWHIVECDEFETVETATWDNVYGGIGGDPFDTGGFGAIPEACGAPNGVLVTVQVSENQDCTYKVVAQRRIAKSAKCATVTQSKTVFETISKRTNKAQNSVLGEPPPATDGVMYTHETTKRPDGKFDTMVQETVEICEPASYSQRKTLRGVIKVETHRNTTDGSYGVARVGDEVTVEKTPGGRWNRTVKTVSSNPAGKVATQCLKTLFEHRHSSTDNTTEGVEEASTAGSGKTHEVVSRLTEEGTWDVTTTETKENSVDSARVATRKTLRGVVTTTVDRNTTNSGTVVEKVGDSVEVEKTPGGLYNRTVTSIHASPVGKLSYDCRRTKFEHRDTVTENLTNPGPENATVAGGGKIHETSSRLTEEGTWDVTNTQVIEEPVSKAEVTQKKTIRGTIKTTVDRNSSSNDTNVSDFGEVKTSRMTPGGRYDISQTTQKAGDYKTWDIKTSLNHLYTERVWFINATQEQYKALMSEKEQAWKLKLTGWIKVERPFSSASVSPEVSYTEWDRYDGSITFTVRWASTSAGQEGELNAIFMSQDSSVSSVGGVKTFKNWSVMGRGKEQLDKILNTPPDANSLGNTDSFSYSPETGCWSFSRKQTVSNVTM